MKLLLYCTKAKPYLVDFKGEYQTYSNGKELDELFDKGFNPNDIMNILNGKIVAECDFEVDTIAMQKGAEDRIYGNNGFMGYGVIKKNGSFNWYDENKACLSEKELFKYFEGFSKPYLIPTNYKCKIGYAINIKNLHIFDEPKELSNYLTRAKEMNTLYGSNWVCESIDKAPQNMMYAQDENQNKKYILISIRPQWLCKILNGEKTIEVRKKVLRDML